MKRVKLISPFVILLILLAMQNCTPNKKNVSEDVDKVEFYSLDDYKSVEKYDVHVHVNTDAQYFVELSKEDNFKLLSINVDVKDEFPSIEDQKNVAVDLVAKFPGNMAFSTAFSIKEFNEEEWHTKTIAYLQESFSQGAIAVKVWKNIGMELKNKEGEFVFIDDPRFDPVINFIKKNDITLIAHIGEPKNCWLPIEEMTVSGDRSYFAEHPEYHMYLHPEYPSYEELVDARDRLLQRHPDLRLVGAHLGSLEWSVDELAKRLDAYPNMAVDMAERISHFQHQAVNDWQKVYDFLIKYQDRLLYGTDIITDANSDPEEIKKYTHSVRTGHWKFFTSDETMTSSKVTGEFKGLKLPKSVVDKIYTENAKTWFPGLVKTN